MGASRHVYIKTACGDVTLHAWMSQTVMPHTHMSESCHAHGWVMPHTKWLMVSDPYERARHVSKRFTCHAWTRHVTRINETPHQTLTMHTHASCHTCEWIISHAFILQVVRVIVWAVWNILTSRVTPINESGHTNECVMSHVWMNDITRANVSSLTSVLNVHHTYHCIHLQKYTHAHTHTHTHTQERGKFKSYMSRIPALHIRMSHVTPLHESCLIYKCVMSHARMMHTSRIWINRATHMQEAFHTHECVMAFTIYIRK